MWFGFAKIKISVFGGENDVKPENSGYRPGNSGLGSPDTPGIRPDTPDFWGMFWAREYNFCVNY